MSITDTKVITHDKFTSSIIHDTIVFVRYHDNIIVDVEDLEASYAAYLELSEGKKFKILSELGEFTSATPEARKYAENLKIEAIAEAVVYNSLAQRLLVRFMQLFRVQPHPHKIFNNIDEAVEWLNSRDL